MGHEGIQLEYGVAPSGQRLWAQVNRALLVVLLAVALAGGYTLLRRAMRPNVQMNLSRAEASILKSLPADAASISYYRGGWFDPVPLVFECTASELAFRDWADAQHWIIHQGGLTVRRFNASEVTLTNAVYCDASDGQGGARLAAYDRDTGVVYYYSHTR